MKRILFAAPLLLATACTAHEQPAIVTISDVAHPVYVAMGGSPAWILMIGDDRIAIRTMTGSGGSHDSWQDHQFPRSLPRTTGQIKAWQSASADETITIETRAEPCRRGERVTFEDTVRVTLNGQVLEGCGGHALRDERQSG